MQSLPDVELGLVTNQIWKSGGGPAQPRWIGPWTWPQWLMQFVSRHDGETYFKLAGRGADHEPFRVEGPLWLIFQPGVSYWHMTERSASRGTEILGLWYYFQLRNDFPPLSERAFTYVLDPEERLVPIVRELYALQQSGEPGSDLIARALATAMLAEVAAASHRGGEGSIESPWRVRSPGSADAMGLLPRVDAETLRRLENGDAPSIDELAAALKMSVSSLAHRFKLETGSTVMERVRWLRIREARRLLTQPGASVKSVAQDLGFCSPFHLSKLFKDVTGVSARGFLKQHGRA